jgi:hypothetical protein
MAAGMRLHIPASRVADVAAAAHVSEATVLRYRRMSPDGTRPRYDLHAASIYLIEQAARGLPPDPQMELTVAKPAKRVPRAPVTSASPKPAPRPRVTIIMPEEAIP